MSPARQVTAEAIAPVSGAGLLKTFVLAALRFYKAAISPAMPSGCKYYPTCSVYAAEAVEKYGVGRGLRMAAARVLRCRPFHAGGWDPVP